MKKLVIIYTSNLCKRVDDLFCLGEWISNGYEVEYCDVADITFHEYLEPIHIEGIKEIKINTERDFRSYVKGNSKNSIFLMWFDCSAYTYNVYRILSKYTATYGVIKNGLIPEINFTPGERKRSITHIISGLKRRFVEIKFQLLFNSCLIKPADYFFSTGAMAKPNCKIDKTTLMSMCNSGDYGYYFKFKPTNKSFILFVDQYLPYHNDNYFFNTCPIEPVSYFLAVNKIFKILENAYHVPVVIAAHPSAMRYKSENPFEGRNIYYNLTAELASKCTAMITHYSTAISYAVIFKKPLLLLTNGVIQANRIEERAYIKKFAEELNCKIVNMDVIDNSDVFFDSVDLQKYSTYKYNYLTNLRSENNDNYYIFTNVISFK